MKLKNQTERKEFLNNYKAWELFKEIPEIEVKLYRYVFPNGTVIIATEYASFTYDRFESGRSYYKKTTAVKYHLILSEGDDFDNSTFFNEHKLYNPAGDNMTAIIKYLTIKRPEV